MNTEMVLESWADHIQNRLQVDLSTCKEGQKLLSNKGEIMTFLGQNKNADPGPFPYNVQYPNGSHGTRTKEGWVYKKHPLPTDSDIIYIFPENH